MIDFGRIWDRMKGGASLASSRRTSEEAENRPYRGATAPRCSFGGLVPPDPVSCERIGRTAGIRGICEPMPDAFGREALDLAGFETTIGMRAGDYRIPVVSPRVDEDDLSTLGGLHSGAFSMGAYRGDDDTLGDVPIPREVMGADRTEPHIGNGRMAYTDDALQYAAEVMFQAAEPLGTKNITDKGEDGERCRVAYVESIARALGMESDGERRNRERFAAACDRAAQSAARQVRAIEDTLVANYRATIDDLQALVGRQAAELERVKAARSTLALRLFATEALVRPVRIDELNAEAAKNGGILDDPADAAELALWQVEMEGRAKRLVAELATMTDIEADFLDGNELRSIARLLQVPGEDAPTIPRLYSDEDRNRASKRALGWKIENMESASFLVDAVAEVLGLRRAGA